MIRITIYLVSSLLVAALVTVAVNFTYLQRVNSFNKQEQVREVDWFQPTVELEPADATPAFSLSEEWLDIGEQRFAEAISYSETTNSSALLVWQAGELVLEKYWDGYDASNYTQTNSLHKSLLSLVVGVAISEGSITSVTDPVSKYLADWIDQPLGQISIEHLLTMTSGLGSEKARFSLLDHSTKLMHAKDISSVAQSLPQSGAPGQRFEYINSNPQLLIDVLEAATGSSYEEYLQEKIWSKVAQNPGYLWMDREQGTPHGFCCLIARPHDLLRIGQLVLNKGEWAGEQVVPAEWVEKAILPSPANANYGYLIWRGSPYSSVRTYTEEDFFGMPHSEPYLADDLVFFDGFGGQRVYIVPSRDLVIVRVGESKFDFDDAILPNRVMEALDVFSSDESLFEVSYEDISFETEHSGPIAVRVSYPLGSAVTHPLIIFSHGHYLANTDYHALTDKWVERGYVVAAPLHLDSGSFEYVTAVAEEYGGDWVAAARPLDMLAILNQADEITATLQHFDGDIRTDKIIAAGHSLGALSAQWTGGATFEPHAWSLYPLPETLSDPRIAAVVALSPPGLYPDHFSEATWETLATPQLVITGTNDVFEHFWTDYREHFISYTAAVPGDNYLLAIDGMDHYLGNLIGRLNREEEPQVLALDLIVERSLAFMDSHLETATSAVSSEQLNNFDEFLQRPGVLNYERR